MMIFFLDYFCRKADIIPSDMPPDCIAPAAITGQVYPQRISNIRPPPPYDELEPPPPAYTALFPGDHLKVINEHLEPSTSSAIS